MTGLAAGLDRRHFQLNKRTNDHDALPVSHWATRAAGRALAATSLEGSGLNLEMTSLAAGKAVSLSPVAG
jgi:hypothetical protein